MDRSKARRPISTLEQGAGGVIADALGIALICLVMLGVAGVLYKALAPGGWLTTALDEIWSNNPWLVWLIGFGSAASLAAGKWWLDRNPSPGLRSEAVVYALMALGLFFFFKLLVTGSL
jgi:hypothetical protein